MGVGGSYSLRRNHPYRLFHILCSDGSRTGCLLCAYIDFGFFGCFLVFLSMCAHIRQPVREQPDTGYWKYAGTPMAADWMNWFLGVEGVLDLFDLGDS